jgi:hypothetical protein
LKEDRPDNNRAKELRDRADGLGWVRHHAAHHLPVSFENNAAANQTARAEESCSTATV